MLCMLGRVINTTTNECNQSLIGSLSYRFVYGYNQGVFSGILTMTSFGKRTRLNVRHRSDD